MRGLDYLKATRRSLAVAGAFHTGIMQPADVQLAEALAGADIHSPEIPVVSNVDAAVHTNPDDIRDTLVTSLQTSGWSAKTRMSKESGISISSMKGTTGLCMQTGGNMARMYADWLKLQQLYVTGKITCGVMIVPSKPTAKLLGDNIVHASRLVQELAFFNKVIHIPLIIFSFE